MTDSEVPIPSSPTKSDLVRHISKTLQDRRKARGLSLEKVYQSLKIRIPYLEALEKGDWDEIPGEVYLRGFLRRYAQYLGFDSDKLLTPYFQFGRTPQKKTTENDPLMKSTELSRFQLIGIGLAAIIVIVLIKLVNQERRLSLPTPQPIVSENDVSSNIEPSKTVGSAPSLEAHKLEIFSPLPLWLRVSSIDKTFEGFIPQGATWTWKGEGTFSIRLGHTRKLVMLFDGKPVTIDEKKKKLELPGEY